MADKHDYSEVIAEMLIQLEKHSRLLDGMLLHQQRIADRLDRSEAVQERIADRLDRSEAVQERIADRLDRSEAGFNNFANAVLDHLSAIRSDLRDVRTTVFQDHEDRLRRLEDFMRRAS